MRKIIVDFNPGVADEYRVFIVGDLYYNPNLKLLVKCTLNRNEDFLGEVWDSKSTHLEGHTYPFSKENFEYFVGTITITQE